ncbi:NAD(P)H-binding protein [Candidatus Woesearchaeota archaeon]|nr:NAD(P)H-binding protein [Candidatus Woesearchaeota archaeon]|tara:strand:+ start:5301 stop:6197 length:897 start_codon:yes stop_codon:yes gene_type:complete
MSYLGLRSKKVAIVGAGAIGTNTAKLLAKAGVGSITLIDRDFIELKNLQRQTLFTKKDVGMPKAIVAKKKLKELNSKTKINAIVADLNYKNASLLSSNLVLDCTDNFETRFLINDYCKKNGVSWVYAAVIRNIGTVYNIIPDNACFRCIFNNHSSLETCDTAGVSNTAVVKTSSLQASEAIKILLKKKYEKNMVRINKQQLIKLKVKKNRDCKSCKGDYEYLTGKKGSKVLKLCGTNTYQVKGKPINLKLLMKKLKGNVKNFDYCIHFNKITLFKDGRAIIKANSSEKAKSIYSRIIG